MHPISHAVVTLVISTGTIAGCGIPSSGGAPSDGGSSSPPPSIDATAASCAPIDSGGRRLLSQMGLYSDIRAQTIAPGVTEYAPAYALWADGADKDRFVLLPPGTQIDTSNMDYWEFPVGTKLFKQFSLNGQLLETRIIERTANTGQSSDYSITPFIWLADGCDAIETPEGATNVLGTTHDVPTSAQCLTCHSGEPGRVLGFSAIQLSKSGAAPTLTSLAQADLLTRPPPAGVDYPVPGDGPTAAALGYLHANCGHCHNPNSSPAKLLSMRLRLNVADRTPAATTIWTTTVNQPTQLFRVAGITERIAAGNPGASAIPYRMDHRGDSAQMPPLATKIVDATGLATIQSWISSLP